MDGIAGPIPLQDKSTWPFRALGVLLDHDRGGETLDGFTRKDAILSQFVVPVRGDLGLPTLDKIDDPTKGVAHLVAVSTNGGLPT